MRDNIYNTAEACVMIFEDFLEEHGIDVPNDEKEQSEGASVLYGTHYGDLVESIDHVLRMYDRFDEEESGKPYRAERLPAERHVDEWDAWDASTFPGWIITGNNDMMGHGTSDIDWIKAKEIADQWYAIDALEIIAKELNDNDRTELQTIIDWTKAADIPKAFLASVPDGTTAGRIVKMFYAYFEQGIVSQDEFLCECMTILTGRRYWHCILHGSVQREWNRCYFPADEEDDVALCEHMYFNLDEQFLVTGPGEKTPTLVTTYLAYDEDGYLKAIAEDIGCKEEEIELQM